MECIMVSEAYQFGLCVRCPTCLSKAGRNCVTKNSKRMTNRHHNLRYKRGRKLQERGWETRHAKGTFEGFSFTGTHIALPEPLQGEFEVIALFKPRGGNTYLMAVHARGMTPNRGCQSQWVKQTTCGMSVSEGSRVRDPDEGIDIITSAMSYALNQYIPSHGKEVRRYVHGREWSEERADIWSA